MGEVKLVREPVFPKHGSCTAFCVLQIDGRCSCGLYKTIGKNQYPDDGDLYPHLSSACCYGTSVVHRGSKDWHVCLHNSSGSVIRTWCTLTLLMTPHMQADTTGKCHAMLVSDGALFQIPSPNYYWVFIQIHCHYSGGEKYTNLWRGTSFRAGSWSGWIWKLCTPSPTNPWSPSKIRWTQYNRTLLIVTN